MNLNAQYCPRCCAPGNLTNRIITDSCGHIKCKQCFLAETDWCVQCKEQSEQAVATCNMDAYAEASATQVQLNTQSKSNKKRTISAHITKVLNGDGTSAYQCTVCLKRFKCRTQQYYHLACQRNVPKKHKCEQCDKAFATKSHLKYHYESHLNSLYSCTKCHKTFKNRMVLKKHERQHSSKSVACSECDKIFRNSITLKNHMLLHARPEQLKHSCPICFKKYATKSTLQQHMLKHKVKQHECHICHRRFQRHSTLKLHMKRHSESECYACTICRKNFSDAAALLRHAKAHQDGIKYYCIHCDISSIRKDNMLRHMRNIHETDKFEDCIKILNSSTLDAAHMPVTSEDHASAEVSAAVPKTVENSCVIKCIGNVEPVKVPTTAILDNCIAISAPEALITTAEQDNNAEQVAVKRKTTTQKSKRQPYDPIKMYRRILTIDEDDDDDDDEDNDDEIAHESTAEFPVNATYSEPVSTPAYLLTHWRKNVMNTYETDVEKCDEQPKVICNMFANNCNSASANLT